MRKRNWFSNGKGFITALLVLFALAVVVPVSSFAQVNENTWTAPDNGVAGISNVNITGSGFPTGHGLILPANVSVSFALTCGGPVVATTNPISVRTLIGTSDRIAVALPGALTNATYFLKVSGTTADTTAFNSGSTCSAVNVTHTNATLSACLPTSSLGVLVPTAPGPVIAYAPNGAWSSSGTGIRRVPIEGGGLPTAIATPGTVNSCSSNPATGQTVCVANTNDVYLITGNTLNTTLHSGSNTTTGFSGGSCQNCGVAINALTNQAVINMGFTPSATSSAIQLLDLNTNTFAAPVPAALTEVSEDISVDPTRGYVLSPSEANIYDLFVTTGGTVTEFSHPIPALGGEADSAAEDCSTGIALTVGEFTSNVYLADLTQATFNSIAHTWTAPERVRTLNGSFSAGASAVTVAPGSAHLGVVTGEFGGQAFAVIQLPSTSGVGIPDIIDYAYIGSGLSFPACGGTFSAGLDPHTTTAYTSPNDGKAYAVFAGGGPPPVCLMIADLAAVLAAPRTGGTNTVTAAGVTALITGGAIRAVPTF